MEPHEIRQLFEYHYWVYDHLFSQVAQLPPAQITAPSNRFYYQTAFLTIRHLMDVDWSWMQWCMGLPGSKYLWEIEDVPDLAALQAFLGRERSRVMTYLASLSADDLAREIDIGTAQGGTPRWFKQWQILLHIVNHGTEHCTELAHYLTDLEHSPGEINFMHYLWQVAPQVSK